MVKHIKSLVTIPVDTDDQHQICNPIMPAGSLVIRRNQILIANQDTELKSMHDHVHTNLAPAAHTHIQGANIPWLLGNAKLWYASDVANHPELVELNGQELSEEDADKLSNVYYGNTLLTNPVVLNGSTFENDEITLSATSFATYNSPDKLFGDEVTIENGFNFQDQWLTNVSDLNAEMSVEINFKSASVSYRPMAYYIIPASGTPTAEITKAPSPNTWYFEGKTTADGEWEVIDSHEDETDWQVLRTNGYDVSTDKQYVAFRLRISKWNAGAEDSGTLVTGLRRFWIFGRKNGYFSVPKVESPSDEFVWVVPKSDLYVGLKHEDVGDIGMTAIKDTLLPAYRLPCDGSLKPASTYETLYNTIVGKYDHELGLEYLGLTQATEESDAYASYNLASEEIISKYCLNVTGHRYPVSWTVKGYSGDTWITLHQVVNLSGVEFEESDSGTFIRADLTQVLNLPKCSKLRIEISAWSDDEGLTAGWASIQVYSHPEGYFYLPNIDNHYIVAENPAVDVSADIISRLQQNVVSLTSTIAKLQSEIQELKKRNDLNE